MTVIYIKLRDVYLCKHNLTILYRKLSIFVLNGITLQIVFSFECVLLLVFFSTCYAFRILSPTVGDRHIYNQFLFFRKVVIVYINHVTLKLNFNLLQHFNMLGSFLCIKTRCCFNFCYCIRGVSYYWLFSLFIKLSKFGGFGAENRYGSQITCNSEPGYFVFFTLLYLHQLAYVLIFCYSTLNFFTVVIAILQLSIYLIPINNHLKNNMYVNVFGSTILKAISRNMIQ